MAWYVCLGRRIYCICAEEGILKERLSIHEYTVKGVNHSLEHSSANG
jgi:hypothetical protein